MGDREGRAGSRLKAAANPGSMPGLEAVQQTGREGKKGAVEAAGRLEQRPGKGRKTNDCNHQFAGL